MTDTTLPSAKDSDYVCPQCGPDPNGSEVHAQTHHTWPPLSDEPAGEAPPRGRFIVLEGLDGCGKTTQIEALSAWLPTSGLMPPGARLVTTREPGGTPLGKYLREVLLHSPEDAAPSRNTELLLYLADRAQHVDTVIRPALDAGHWVISDRFHGSTVAYQGYGRGHSPQILDALYHFTCEDAQPDCVLWLDFPREELERRMQDRGYAPDRLESAMRFKLYKLHTSFKTQWLGHPETWERVSARGSIEEVTARCRLALCKKFPTFAVNHRV